MPSVTYLDAAQVSAAFAKGGPLFKEAGDGRYIVIAGRRDKEAPPELHARYTEIVYVVKGSATMLTGGELIDSQAAAPDELRGSGIRNGTPRNLSEGDVLIIPAGMPHQFSAVSGPFLYYAVKVK